MSMAALLRGYRSLYKRCNKHADITLVSCRSMASKTPVGFIGIGNMGTPMARNLLKHGYPVIATDVFPESCKELCDSGAQILDCPADVAERADRIITMLPSSPNVIEVYTGPNGILKKVKKGTLLIDSSTIDPSVSKEMAVAAEKMGAVYMDAPVSGGVGAASLAKLTFMVGGVEVEFNAAKELLTCMGANVVYCGQVGSGQAVKICNNMMLAIGMIGTAETMNLGISSNHSSPHHGPSMEWNWLGASGIQCWTGNDGSVVTMSSLIRASHPLS
ncbi:3-hydroxyisobutyrate dehydrogenase a isoform X2 [Triplophysa dalaica]|uniref:3-hydroxyisobutyrate dehydrogenase a isoform X2 n=1 Tax=Triplophysa dalaica TaxID=1582913 RepID=UPI0024DFA799|nr:3-hydroxyisobutyrate dehydrogenase a isoform X2 [Triplophysa dalaica]